MMPVTLFVVFFCYTLHFRCRKNFHVKIYTTVLYGSFVLGLHFLARRCEAGSGAEVAVNKGF